MDDQLPRQVCHKIEPKKKNTHTHTRGDMDDFITLNNYKMKQSKLDTSMNEGKGSYMRNMKGLAKVDNHLGRQRQRHLQISFGHLACM
jgi:hypothetical protein